MLVALSVRPLLTEVGVVDVRPVEVMLSSAVSGSSVRPSAEEYADSAEEVRSSALPRRCFICVSVVRESEPGIEVIGAARAAVRKRSWMKRRVASVQRRRE